MCILFFCGDSGGDPHSRDALFKSAVGAAAGGPAACFRALNQYFYPWIYCEHPVAAVPRWISNCESPGGVDVDVSVMWMVGGRPVMDGWPVRVFNLPTIQGDHDPEKGTFKEWMDAEVQPGQ